MSRLTAVVAAEAAWRDAEGPDAEAAAWDAWIAAATAASVCHLPGCHEPSDGTDMCTHHRALFGHEASES